MFMKKKSVLENRHKLLQESFEKNYSENTLLQIASHMKEIPTNQKEAEAGRFISLMKTMTETEILKNL